MGYIRQITGGRSRLVEKSTERYAIVLRAVTPGAPSRTPPAVRRASAYLYRAVRPQVNRRNVRTPIALRRSRSAPRRQSIPRSQRVGLRRSRREVDTRRYETDGWSLNTFANGGSVWAQADDRFVQGRA